MTEAPVTVAGTTLQRKRRWLTREQSALLPEWQAKWTDIGSSTEPADRAAAERAIATIYRDLTLPPPNVVWCGSPLSMIITASVVLSTPPGYWRGFNPVRARAGSLLQASIDESVEATLAAPGGLSRCWASVAHPFRVAARSSISKEIREGVEEWVVASVRRSLGLHEVFTPIRHWIWHAVMDDLDALGHERGAFEPSPVSSEPIMAGRASPRDGQFAGVWYARWLELVHGQHNADWLARYDYLAEIYDLPSKGAKDSGYRLLAASAGWAMPRSRTFWVCERPTVVLRDDDGRLHSENGPALVFRDGWALDFWHGVYLRRRWLQKDERLDPDFLLTWPQVDQRHALIEIAGGWERILSRERTTVIDVNRDPSIGRLFEWAGPGRTARFLQVLCGTGRTFVLPVPPGCRTAHEANAWTFDMRADEYAPEVRT
jgi:hypothetical protein